MIRFKLRTVLILTALLPAAFGVLWRCGQIDAGSFPDGLGERWSYVRVGSYGVQVSPSGVSFCRAVAWATHKPSHNYVLVIDGIEIPPAPEIGEQRSSHPWNGRQWHPVYEYLARIEWGNPIESVAPVAPAAKRLGLFQ